MKIAVEGCAHGELELIYETVRELEEKQNIEIDLLICCGDFQATRNEDDLRCMAVPPKYYDMGSFYKYYSGEKEAPILTVFIGGNHEASNYLQELPYGGWVAPRIYYLGYAGVINIAGVRIGGLSGIYKGPDYLCGHFEKPPYTSSEQRSVYHIRNLEAFRLKQLSGPIDILLSHDWPSRIWDHGNCEQLLRFKPFLREDIENGRLGSKPAEELLNALQPKYWFAAHHHCKFAALVEHADTKNVTKFLALDKCLPHRRFLQVVDVPHDPDLAIELQYDLEWLTVLHLTNHLLSIRKGSNFMPTVYSAERCKFSPTEEERSKVLDLLNGELTIPEGFAKTADVYDPDSPKAAPRQPSPVVNPQTEALCSKLGVDDPLVMLDAYDRSHVDIPEEDDEAAYETFLKTPSRSSLSLPEPKFSADASLVEPESKGASTNDVSVSSLSDVNESVEEESDEPKRDFPSKKFKRRNASIYASEDT